MQSEELGRLGGGGGGVQEEVKDGEPLTDRSEREQ